MALPALGIKALEALVLQRFLNTTGGGQNRSVPNNPAANPLNDPAIRASLLSQGLATETGNIPGSNVPAVQTNVPSLANQISPQTGVSGVNPNIPTRGVLGLEGDAAFADTARAFREQLARQTAGEISDINRQFAGAGRFTSGQRLSTIQEAQTGAREEFGRFLGGTALERFLQKQRLSSAERIAQAQIEAQTGGGRLGAVTSIFGSLANIFAQNPQFVIDLFTRGGGSVDTGDPFSRFDPNAPGIEVL